MIFYISFILIISLLLLFDFFSKDKFNITGIVVVLIMTFVTGLRDNVGYDFQSYKIIYEEGFNLDKFELGFQWLIIALKYFNVSYYFLNLVMAFFTYLFLYLSIRRLTKHSNMAILIYLLISGLFLNSLVIIRQAFAMSATFYAFSFLIRKEYYRYIIFMIIAVAFHYTAVILGLFHWLSLKYAKKLNTLHYLCAIGFSLLIAKLNIVNIISILFVGSKYAVYSGGESVSFVKLLVLNSFLILMVLFSDRYISKNENNSHYLFFTAIGIIMVNCFSSIIVITRMAYYFRIFEIILIAEFIYLFTKKTRLMVLAAVYLFYFGIFYSSLNNDINAVQDGPKLIPYKNVVIERMYELN